MAKKDPKEEAKNYEKAEPKRGNDVIEIELKKCSRCGLCRFACQPLQQIKIESDGPRGRIILMDKKKAGEFLFTCNLCKHCNEICPAKVDVAAAILKAREQYRLQNNEDMIKHIREHGNVYGDMSGGKKPKSLQCC